MTTGRLILLAGPDGSGKSTLGQRLVEALRPTVPDDLPVRYVHCGPFPRVQDGLARLYAEAILPAVLGLAHVVLDRSWLCETVYGPIFRGGSRLEPWQVAMLERLALRCEAQVVLCLPPPAVCLATWRARRKQAGRADVEAGYAEGQLRQVHAAYCVLKTAIPLRGYDYSHDERLEPVLHDPNRSTAHEAGTASAGDLEAPVVLVGEAFGEVKNQDPFHQHPFVSFNRAGCSAWLTEQLLTVTSERQLLWLNSDFEVRSLTNLIRHRPRRQVVALGALSAGVLQNLGIQHVAVAHPQHAKRFRHHQPYELLRLVKEALS